MTMKISLYTQKLMQAFILIIRHLVRIYIPWNKENSPLGAVFYNELIAYCLSHTFIFPTHSME